METRLTEAYAEVLLKNSETVFFKSNLRFLNNQNGWRPGKLHLFIGPTHSGKSTLTRTVMLDLLRKNKKVLIWLSEESVDDFLTELYKSGVKENLDNIIFFSEVDEMENIFKKNFVSEKIKSLIEENEIDLVLIDNITTSSIYLDRPVKEQSTAAWFLKSICIKSDIPFVVIAHTGASVFNNSLITPNDIRGSKTIINIAEFLYILQVIESQKSITSILRVAKHRGQTVQEKIYRLDYSNELSIFRESVAINFNSFKELFKLRDRL